jgi:hypothetical protein
MAKRRMTATERRAVSARMKRYWAARRAGKENGAVTFTDATTVGVAPSRAVLLRTLAPLGARLRLQQIEEEREQLRAFLGEDR